MTKKLFKSQQAKLHKKMINTMVGEEKLNQIRLAKSIYLAIAQLQMKSYAKD